MKKFLKVLLSLANIYKIISKITRQQGGDNSNTDNGRTATTTVVMAEATTETMMAMAVATLRVTPMGEQ